MDSRGGFTWLDVSDADSEHAWQKLGMQARHDIIQFTHKAAFWHNSISIGTMAYI
jgi:hypothetical protein